MSRSPDTTKREPEATAGPPAGDASILYATDIQKSYYLGRTTLTVLDGVDVKIARGSFTVILGASGSGKSTLLHILGALDIPQRGQVWFDGQPLFEPESKRVFPDAAKRGRAGDAPARQPSSAGGRGGAILEPLRNRMRNVRVGFVFQFYHLLPEFDVLENVMMPALVGRSVADWSAGRARIRERAVHVLRQVEMEHRIHHRPGELSGGERQRVAIARALVNHPDVLLADEPTGNLDTRTGGEILQRLRDLHSKGQTIVMVTHDPEVARLADQTIRLVDGRAT